MNRAVVPPSPPLDAYTFSPNSITTIPGDVEFYLDVRDVDSDRQRLTTQDIVTRAEETAARRGLRCEWEVVSDTSPVVLPKWLRDLTTAAAKRLDVPHRVTTSGRDTTPVFSLAPFPPPCSSSQAVTVSATARRMDEHGGHRHRPRRRSRRALKTSTHS